MIHWGDAPDIADREQQPPATEDARAALWDAFIEWCKGDRPKSDSEWSTLVHYVYVNMRGQGDWHHERINSVILAFAESEGWPGVLRALARAMSEQAA
jgi:hypothetical protein